MGTLPSSSGIRQIDDRSVLLEHRVAAEDDFGTAAQAVFALIKEARERHPGALRGLRLSVDGHEGERAGFDDDFFEFQQEFLLGALGRFLTWVEMPLTGKLGNPDPQEEDLPDRLRINADG